MTTGATIWIVGFMFFAGICMADEDERVSELSRIVMMLLGVVLWPIFLGMIVEKALDHFDKRLGVEDGEA